jgi:hypothetical protein
MEARQMRIVDAVRRSIEEDAQDCWSIYTRGGCGHHLHVSTRCAPDGADAEIFRRLARGQPSTRAGVAFIERAGAMPSWMLDRRVGSRQRPWYRACLWSRLPVIMVTE